jgi:hypothetical protein
MNEIISTLIDIFSVYILIGIVFGIWFVLRGATKLDEGVKGTPWHFRLILFPGSVLIWSVLTYKLLIKK